RGRGSRLTAASRHAADAQREGGVARQLYGGGSAIVSVVALHVGERERARHWFDGHGPGVDHLYGEHVAGLGSLTGGTDRDAELPCTRVLPTEVLQVVLPRPASHVGGVVPLVDRVQPRGVHLGQDLAEEAQARWGL